MMKLLRYTLGISIMMFLAGCAIPHPPLPFDSSNPLKRVAVLPLKNDSNDVDGPDVLRKKMVQALERRSYVVKDLKETDQILRDRMGITLGGQLSLATAQQLSETLGVEGLLYGTLMDFDETTTGVINVKKVRGKFKLVNALNGQSVWDRGLGVRSEQRMSGNAGIAGTILARTADARDKEVPWITIQSTSTGSQKLGESFAIGLGTKLLTKAIGMHLDHESAELARRLAETIPWGPGQGAVAAVPAPKIVMSEITTPEPPSFGYMDWKGKRDFSAMAYSESYDKGRNNTFIMEMPLAVAGEKFRMDMDMTRTMKGDAGSPLSKMVMIVRGDKRASYSLYPNSKRYMIHSDKDTEAAEEKPKVEKTSAGSEKIGKYATNKYKVRITYKNGKVEEGFIWNARDLDGITIRSEVENKDYRVTTELRNIVLKTPVASLFEIPTDYAEAKNIMDLMATEPKNK